MQSPDQKLDDVQPAEQHTAFPESEAPSVEEIQIADHVSEGECIETNLHVEELTNAEHQSDLELVHEQSENPPSRPARTTDWSKFDPIMPSRNDRRRRRQPSILTMIPTVLGGLAAIPIALLLIWFVLGTDPLKLAPTIARYAPWLVPNKLLHTDDHLDVIARLPESAIPKPGESGFRRFDDVLPTTSIDKNSQREPSPVSTASAEEKLQSASPLLTAITEHEDEPDGTPVVVLLNRVQSGLNAWKARTPDKAEQRKIAKDLYGNLSELSIATTKRTVPALQSIGASVLQQDDVFDLINQGARHWYAKRKTEIVGMAICCEVQEIEKVNGHWVVTGVTTGKTQTAVQLHLTGSNMASPKLGAVTFVLGIAQQESEDSGKKAVESTPNSMTIDAHYMQSLPSRPSKLTQVGIINDRRQ